MFHAGIGVMMGLWWFSAVLISCEAVLLTDAQYLVVVRQVRAFFSRSDEARLLTPSSSVAVAASTL